MSKILIFQFMIVCCLCGCGYKMGQVSNPNLNNTAIEVKNKTQYANLSQWARSEFQRNLFQRSGLHVATRENANALVKAEVVSASFSSAAQRRLSDVERDDRQDRYLKDYTTSLYRGTVVVKFTVVSMSNDQNVLIPERVVEGSAVIPYTPDITVAQGDVFKAAISQAVDTMIEEISEAW